MNNTRYHEHSGSLEHGPFGKTLGCDFEDHFDRCRMCKRHSEWWS